MTHRYTLAALMLAAMSIPAAAQQTTQPDTSKKAGVSAPQPDTSKKAGVSGTTTTTSPGAIAEPAKATDSTSAAPTTPSSMTPSPASPSPGASVTAPAPSNAGTSVTAPAPSNAGASVTAPSPSGASVSAAPSGETGKVQPTSGAVKVDVKVAPTLANTVKISADSAFALARASNDAGEISSAELEMKEKALVYNIKMLKGAGASVVHVDAMTGEVVKDKKYGGLKASAENDKQIKKLDEAKKDSSATAKP